MEGIALKGESPNGSSKGCAKGKQFQSIGITIANFYDFFFFFFVGGVGKEISCLQFQIPNNIRNYIRMFLS